MAAILAAGIVLFPPFTRHVIEPSRWVPLCALPAALILAWGVMPLFLRRLSAERVVFLSFLLLALFLTSLNRPAAEYLGNYKSVKKLSSVLSASLREGDVVAQYQTYRQGLPFYTKRRCVLVNEVGELEFGADRAADRKDVLPRRRGVPRPVEFAGPRLLRGPHRQAVGVSGEVPRPPVALPVR